MPIPNACCVEKMRQKYNHNSWALGFVIHVAISGTDASDPQPFFYPLTCFNLTSQFSTATDTELRKQARASIQVA